MSRFELTKSAVADLDELWLYIAADNVDAADRVSARSWVRASCSRNIPSWGMLAATSPRGPCSSGRAGATCSSTHQRPRPFASLPSCTARATWPRSSTIATDGAPPGCAWNCPCDRLKQLVSGLLWPPHSGDDMAEMLMFMGAIEGSGGGGDYYAGLWRAKRKYS